MKIILAILIAVVATGSIKGQYVTDVYTATTNEVNDGLNQTKPVTPWGLKNWIGGGSANAITNRQTNVTLAGTFSGDGSGLNQLSVNGFHGHDTNIVYLTGAGNPGANQKFVWNTNELYPIGYLSEPYLGDWHIAYNAGAWVVYYGGFSPMYRSTNFPAQWNLVSGTAPAPTGDFQTNLVPLVGVSSNDGSGIINVRSSSLVGTISDSALSTNIARLNQNAVWTSNGVATATISTNGNFNLSGSGVMGGIGVTNKTLTVVGVGSIQSFSTDGNKKFYVSSFSDDVYISSTRNSTSGTALWETSSSTVNSSNPKWAFGMLSGSPEFLITKFDGATTFVPFRVGVDGSVKTATTITATNGFILTPKTSATTYAQVGTSNTVVLYGDNAIPQTIYARSFNAQSNAVDVPFVSMAPRWIDAPGQIIPLAVGSGALTIADMGDGIFGYQFDRIFGANVYGTQKLPFNSEAPHNLYATNAYYLLSNTNLYIEPHFHGRPLTAPAAPNTNISFQVVWKACTVGLNPSFTFTNTATYGLIAGTTNEVLVEFTHTPYATNQPNITTVWPATITVINPGSNSYMEQAGAAFVIRQPSFHVPVSSFHGSATDATQ